MVQKSQYWVLTTSSKSYIYGLSSLIKIWGLYHLLLLTLESQMRLEVPLTFCNTCVTLI